MESTMQSIEFARAIASLIRYESHGNQTTTTTRSERSIADD